MDEVTLTLPVHVYRDNPADEDDPIAMEVYEVDVDGGQIWVYCK